MLTPAGRERERELLSGRGGAGCGGLRSDSRVVVFVVQKAFLGDDSLTDGLDAPIHAHVKHSVSGSAQAHSSLTDSGNANTIDA